jgi:autotransporter translocation and assembly factor TamB
VKRFVQIVALLCTLVVGAGALAVIVSQTAWFKDWLRGFIVRQADGYVNGRLTIDRLDGNLFFGIELENVRLTMDGQPVVSVNDIGLDYSVFDFIGGGLVLDDIRLNRPYVHLQRTGDGWNLGRLLKEQEREADREGPRRPVSIGEIGISDGTFVISGPVGTSGVDVPERIDGLNARVGFEYEPVHYTLDIGHLSFRTSQPGVELHELSGKVAVRDDSLFLEDVAVRTRESSLQLDGVVENYITAPVAKLIASSDKLALDEFAVLVPALRGFTLQPAFEIRAYGPLDRLRLTVNARSDAGNIAGEVVADVSGPEHAVAGEINLERLDLAPLLRDEARRSRITGRASIDLKLAPSRRDGALTGLSGTWQVTAPEVAMMGYAARNVEARGRFAGGVIHLDGRAAAYGGRATARGTIDTNEPVRVNLRGQAEGLDLRNLPPALKAPGVPGDLNVAYHVEGVVGGRRDLSASVTFRRSALAGAVIEEGSTARIRLTEEQTQYAADATVRGLDLQKVGEGFGIEALAADRYRTDLNGQFAVEGSGTELEALSLNARGTLTESSLLEGTVPELTFEARVHDRDAQIRAIGRFSGFDPALAAGRPSLAGELAGSLDATATVRQLGGEFGPDSFSAAGRVDLADSRMGELVIDRAAVEGTYDARHGEITLLQVEGPALSLEASGPIDLRPAGRSSNLQFRADLKQLAPLGALGGAALSGSAQTEGRITGNGDELTVAGSLNASNIKYANTSVLSAASEYGVRLPKLSTAAAEVSVNGRATLLEIAGRQLTQADVEATWREQTVTFKTTLSDERRVVSAAGDVVLHPDHQEIHLPDFAIQTAGVEWRTLPGTEAAVRYGRDRVEIDNLQLASGDQRISAAGAFGRAGDTVRVEATNVDLAAVDRLALGEQRFAGSLTATATLAGTREAPQVDASFGVTGGSFRQFQYESLNGRVDYSVAGLRLDVRLDQRPDAWITAKGFVPATFFRAAPTPRAPAEHLPAPEGEALDVRVVSSALDLGIVQGFVPQLSSVTGTLQADLRATGSAGDPHLAGSIDIRNGAFTVADLTKGGYTGLDTRISLDTDRVVIDEFRVLDEHKNWLRVSGELAVHERKVGQVQIGIQASQFEIIDNELADIKLNTDLKITGELLQPRVEGEVAVHTGTVHIGRVLEQTTSDAYALEPTALEAAPRAAVSPEQGATAVAEAGGAPAGGAAARSGPTREAAEPTGTFFDGLALDVAVRIPNNMVVKGEGLNPSGASPVSLGDVNVTIGGDVRARKASGRSDVELVGTVNTVRGTYDFQGRRFEIERDGRIQFVGTTPVDPRLDLTARRVISGVEALIHVRGTARAPQLQLTSRPPLDEADILSLIVFNQPVNALGEGQQVSLAQRAGALATGFVASSLAQSIGGALELDVFEIQTTADNGGGGSLTVGEQVGERLFLKFRQAFGAQSVSEFILEYQLADFLRLQTSIAEGNTATQRTLMQRVEQGGVDLIFFFSY